MRVGCFWSGDLCHPDDWLADFHWKPHALEPATDTRSLSRRSVNRAAQTARPRAGFRNWPPENGQRPISKVLRLAALITTLVALAAIALG
jgi:hypothetical protein